MSEKKYVLFTTQDFVLDDEFIDWVQDPDEKSIAFWTAFLKRYPDKKEPIEEARFIIRGMQVTDPEIPERKLEEIYNRLEIRKHLPGKAIRPVYLKYAASVALLLLAGFLFYMIALRTPEIPLAHIDPAGITTGEVKLADGSIYEFDTRETTIQQTSGGEILVNNDTVREISGTRSFDPASYIQVNIPYGKISDVILPDGTRIWLNSGSQLSYPAQFSKGDRQVFLSGEAFFDVYPDAGKPFSVITKDIRLEVLGTSFNLSAYPDESSAHAVLVEGKVNVRKNKALSRSQVMEPGDKLTFNRDRGEFLKEKVDPEYYASWVKGYLLFENTPTTEVFRKLERFYNRKIIADEEALDQTTFSGKLDIQDNLIEVLNVISFASAVQVTKDENMYKITPRINEEKIINDQ